MKYLGKITDNKDLVTKEYVDNRSVHVVKGTQTAATGSWTGVIDVPALYDGLTIAYYLPYAGSGNATLNLTLSGGGTTGAVNCYYNANNRLTTHFAQGTVVYMTYWSAGSISVSGTATTDNRWVSLADYNSDATGYYTRKIYPNMKAGANGVFPYTLIMQLPDGTWESLVTSSSTGTSKARNTHGFLLGHVLCMYANATYTSANIATYNVWSAHSGLIDHRYSFNTANNSTNGTTGYKPIYLVGTVTNGLFYLDSTWWTQTLPTSANGKVYIYIGDAYDYYRMTLSEEKPMYVYTNGAVREYSQDAGTVNGLTVQTAVPSGAVFTDTNTKVTAVGNHYTPSGGTTTSASGATGTSGTTVQVVTGITKDAAGHVTGITSGAATDTTYESKAAASGGTAVSLVTTGEKYTWNNKQAALVSGTNIKTVNNQSLLGSGNISISGGGGGVSFDDIYPVGSIYMSVNSTNPGTLFGGTWTQIQDKFLLSAGTTYTAGATGGSADAIIPYHRHSVAAVTSGAMSANESHRHSVGYMSGNRGSGSTATRVGPYGESTESGSVTTHATSLAHTHTVPAHNTAYEGTSGNTVGANMPPYLVVYIWQRTA